MFFKPITSIDELVSRKRDYKSVCWWIESNIEWSNKDRWRWPTSEEVLRTRKTLCKGFAVLAYDALKRLGYDPHIVGLMWDAPSKETWDGKSHHAVVMVELGDASRPAWRCIDNGSINGCGKATSLLEAVLNYCPEVRWAGERDCRGGHLMTLVSKL